MLHTGKEQNYIFELHNLPSSTTTVLTIKCGTAGKQIHHEETSHATFWLLIFTGKDHSEDLSIHWIIILKKK